MYVWFIRLQISLSDIKWPYYPQVLLVHRLIIDVFSTSYRLHELAKCPLVRHFRYFPRLCWDPSIWGGIQKISQTPFQIIRSIKALKLFLVLEQFDRRGRCTWAGACETKLLPAAGDFDQLVPKSRSTNPSCPVTVMGRSKQVIINRSCGI